jgi:HEAT repeat protein
MNPFSFGRYRSVLAFLIVPVAAAAATCSAGHLSGNYGTSPSGYGDRRTTEELLLTLKHARGYERQLAVDALSARSPLPQSAVPTLAECIKDRSPAIRAACASLLGNVAPLVPQQKTLLSDAMRDPREEVQWAAATALLQIEPQNGAAQNYVRTMAEDWKPNAADPLVEQRFAAPAVSDLVRPVLLARLKTSEPKVRHQIALHLGVDAVPDEISQALDDPDDQIRFRAALALTENRIPSEKAMKVLCESLHKSTDRLQVTILCQKIVGTKIRTKEVCAAFLAELGNQDPQVRASAADALGQLNAIDSVPDLLRARGDKASEVGRSAESAIAAMQWLPNDIVPTLMDEILDPNPQHSADWAVEAISKTQVDGDVVRRLISATLQESPLVRLRAVRAITDLAYHNEHADSPVPAVFNALNDKDPNVREAAVRALAKTAGNLPRAAAAFVDAATDPNPRVRAAAVYALATVAPLAERTRQTTIAALRDIDEIVSSAAANSLRDPALFELLQSADLRLRLIALRRLSPSWFDDPNMFRILNATLDDESQEMRAAAAEAIGRLGNFYLPDGADLASQKLARDRRYLTSQATPELVKLLKTFDTNCRLSAVRALGDFGPASDSLIFEVANLEHDPDPKVRAAAVAAIGQMIQPSNTSRINVFTRFLSDADASVREQALLQITLRATDDSAIEPVLKLMLDRDPLIRRYAAEVLGNASAQHREKIIPALDQALNDSDDDVRRAAEDGLGRYGWTAPEVVPLLVSKLKLPDAKLRSIALRTLKKVGLNADVAVPDIVAVFESSDPFSQNDSTASEAVDALVELETEPTSLLKLMLASEAASKHVGEVFKDTAKDVLPQLKANLKSKEARQQINAATAVSSFHEAQTTAVADLIAVLSACKNRQVCEAADAALQQMGEPGLEALAKLQADPDWAKAVVRYLQENYRVDADADWASTKICGLESPAREAVVRSLTAIVKTHKKDALAQKAREILHNSGFYYDEEQVR